MEHQALAAPHAGRSACSAACHLAAAPSQPTTHLIEGALLVALYPLVQHVAGPAACSVQGQALLHCAHMPATAAATAGGGGAAGRAGRRRRDRAAAGRAGGGGRGQPELHRSSSGAIGVHCVHLIACLVHQHHLNIEREGDQGRRGLLRGKGSREGEACWEGGMEAKEAGAC